MYVQFCLTLVFLLFTCVSFSGVFKPRPFPLSLVYNVSRVSWPPVAERLVVLDFASSPSTCVWMFLFIYYYFYCFWINFFTDFGLLPHFILLHLGPVCICHYIITVLRAATYILSSTLVPSLVSQFRYQIQCGPHCLIYGRSVAERPQHTTQMLNPHH